ncbi:carbohydrate ABC transporter permease [Halobacteriaceae archaeon GCM10025711]
MSTDHRPSGGGSTSGGVSLLGWTERLSETQFAYLLLVPVFLLLGVIAFWPLLRTFEISLHKDMLTSGSLYGAFVGLDNYVNLLTGTGSTTALLPRPFLPQVTVNGAFPFVHFGNLFTSALSVTVIFTVVGVTFETIIGFGQALVLDQDFRGRRWVRVAVILPWAVPIVIQGMIFFLLFQPDIGFVVEPLQNLGLLSSSPLSNSQDSLFIIIVADVWKTSAFMALLILAGLQSVDRNLYDVAEVAGASPWQRFRMITLPLVLPTVLVAMLFRTIQSMRVFGIIQTVAGCSTVPSLTCLVYQSWSQRLYGSSATVAFVTAAIIAAMVAVYIWKFREEAI